MAKLAEPAAFYDAALPKANYRGGYRDLWQRTGRLVPPDSRVVELGCGPGMLRPYLNVRSYIGLDFSPAAIRLALRQFPRVDFRVADVREPIPPADCYVMNEVLEHLDDDLDLLRSLPPSTVVLSVPSFDSTSHVRFFEKEGSAVKRYGRVLAIDHVEYVKHGTAGRFFHLMRGRRE
jgi:trans-aconitate methyltransferase